MSIEALEDVLAGMGLTNIGSIHWNLSTAQLYESSIRRREAFLAHLGPLVTRTGSFTGRAPNDKFVVDEPSSRDKIWWGKVNRPFPEDKFDKLWNKVCTFLQGQEVFVQDLLVGAGLGPYVHIRLRPQRKLLHEINLGLVAAKPSPGIR